MMKRIMWLEDDAYFVKKLMRPFEEEGYEIKIYETAALFIDDIDLVPSSDLVVIDLLVPSGVFDESVTYAGLEVLRKVSALPRVPPVLVFSVVFQRNVEETVNKYTKNFIQKPVRLGDFTSRVRSLLDQENKVQGERT
jgi:DNA-binding NtrC family response regulator